LLIVFCYLLFVICYLLFVICYLLFVICYLLFVICYLLFFVIVICYLLLILCSPHGSNVVFFKGKSLYFCNTPKLKKSVRPLNLGPIDPLRSKSNTPNLLTLPRRGVKFKFSATNGVGNRGNSRGSRGSRGSRASG
jgi:hypothetical protein